MTAVLHTWGQNLSRHVHLHCLVPGGALTEAGAWNRAKSNYLFPVKALSRHFRGRMVSQLRHSAQRGELQRITRPAEVDKLLDSLMQFDWVVYTKACLNRTDTVIRYLARYSRKTALSNSRLLAIHQDKVDFRYRRKDVWACVHPLETKTRERPSSSDENSPIKEKKGHYENN